MALPRVLASPLNESERNPIAELSRLAVVGYFRPTSQFQRLVEAIRSNRFFGLSQCQSPLGKHV
jgi:hypothetical protein